MPAPAPGILRRLAGVAAATGLALAGAVLAAAPASAAACSGTSGVTVVVDTGSSVSTRCASGNPDSAWSALQAAGFGITPVTQFPGAICRINDYPASTDCMRMPPGDAYWAFFHAKRGGSWVYSSSGARSYDPPSGSVVGFRFGSGQQPRVAPPAPATTEPAPTRTTSKPKATTSAPKPTAPKQATSAPKKSSGAAGSATGTSKSTRKATSSAATSTSPPASPRPTASGSASASPAASASPSRTASELAAAPTSAHDEGGNGTNGATTLALGSALLLLVGGAAGWAAWKRRS